MIEESGKVIAIEEPGLVWVETIRKSSCGSCAAEKGCGTGAISKALSGKRSYVKALSDIDNLQTGDEVVIGVPEDFILRSTLRLYLLPLITMLLAMIAASQWFNYGDAGVLMGAMVGLGIGLGTVRLLDRFTSLSMRDHPRVLHRGIMSGLRSCDLS